METTFLSAQLTPKRHLSANYQLSSFRLQTCLPSFGRNFVDDGAIGGRDLGFGSDWGYSVARMARMECLRFSASSNRGCASGRP